MRKIAFGYKIENGEIRINEEEANLIRRMSNSYLEGKSFQSIIDEEKLDLGICVLKQILFDKRNEGYNDYPSIYEEGTLEKMNAMRNIRAGFRIGRTKAKCGVKIYNYFILPDANPNSKDDIEEMYKSIRGEVK